MAKILNYRENDLCFYYIHKAKNCKCWSQLIKSVPERNLYLIYWPKEIEKKMLISTGIGIQNM